MCLVTLIFLQDLLDKFLLGSKNILAGAYKNMPLATREMEQLVNKNCQLIDLFRKDIQVQCHQDISMRSVKKVLLSRLEELLEKVCSVTYMNAKMATDTSLKILFSFPIFLF